MISKKMEQALSDQVNFEFYSAYFYLSMSAHCASIGLKGFANWFMVQYQEETFHAMKIYQFILDRGGVVHLQAINEPEQSFASPLEMFTKTLEHEQEVTRRFNELSDLSFVEKDHASRIFLQWFVTEQIEEEANVNEAIDRLKMVGQEKSGLFMLDNEFATRTFVAPTA